MRPWNRRLSEERKSEILKKITNNNRKTIETKGHKTKSTE